MPSRRTDASFGAAVRQLLGQRKLSLRAAAYKTGLDHTTIMDMGRGHVPQRRTVMDFARGLGEPVNKWLQLAGYDPIPEAEGAQQPSRERDDQMPVPPPPEAVRKAIEEAPTREAKIEIAYEYIMRPEFGIRAGSFAMLTFPTEAKLAIIRLLERAEGIQILPPDLF